MSSGGKQRKGGSDAISSARLSLSFTVRVTTSHYSPRKRLLLVTQRPEYKAFLSPIASRSSKYCCELSPRQIKREETASVCCLIAACCLRQHWETSWTASEKDRICLLHQIETLSGYQARDVCQAWHTDQSRSSAPRRPEQIFKCSDSAPRLTGSSLLPAPSY